MIRVLEGRYVSDEKSREVFSVTPWATKGKRRVLCYVQGNRRKKKKKMEAAYQRRLWDPEIKSVFQNNTLRASEHDAKDALSKLLQMGPVAKYQKGRRRVLCYVQGNGRRKKKKMEAAYQRRLCDLGIKSVFQNNTLRARRNLFVSRITEACFEAIANKDKATARKEQSIKKTTQTIISLLSEVASPLFKGSLDVDEDIGVDEASSAIDNFFVIGESDVESMEVPSKFGEFLKNKESVEEVVVVGGEVRGVNEVLEGRDVFSEKSHEVFSVTPWAMEGRRMVLCYVQGNGRQKKKKMEAAYQRRLRNLGIKNVFQDNTLRARWF
nr:hypothetical protein [Tanacetum cinerariifolium]